MYYNMGMGSKKTKNKITKTPKIRHSSGQTPAARAKTQQKYESSPKQVKNREERNAARRLLMKTGKVSKGDGKDVDHISGLSAGNTQSNLRILDKSTNRRYNRRSQKTKAPKKF
jgi:hypothetical protein